MRASISTFKGGRAIKALKLAPHLRDITIPNTTFTEAKVCAIMIFPVRQQRRFIALIPASRPAHSLTSLKDS
jgi:hypothetical protein